MPDLDPAIWENRTLGDAAHNENLERLEKQQHEDRNARVEGREPREVIVERTYPDWAPTVNDRTGTVPSNYQAVHFADEGQNDIPADSGHNDETANSLAVQDKKEEDAETPEGDEIPAETEPSAVDPDEESDSTKWA